MQNYHLMTPGPVPIPKKIREILAEPAIHHRTPEFMTVFKRCLHNLGKVYETQRPVFIHTSTGSGAMESAIVNLLSPGDEVLAVVSGKFGERWAEMAQAYGGNVRKIDIPWGQSVKPEQIEEALKKYPDTRIVLCQACETSTGALHPIREIGAVVARTSALFVVDGITALGAMPMPFDEWKIDVLIGGSQKAFMLPTGIAFISFSEKAWEVCQKARSPRYYFDLRREHESNLKGETHFSSPVMHIRALDQVLEDILAVGVGKVFARIASLSAATRVASSYFGLQVAAQTPAPAVTSIRLPPTTDGQKLRDDMEKLFHVTVMGGQDLWKGKVIRIGHMGAISDEDVFATLNALAKSLMQQGYDISPESLQSAREQAQARLLQNPMVL